MADLFSSLDCNQINLNFILWGTPMFLVLLFNKVNKKLNHFSIFSSLISEIHSSSRKDTPPLLLMCFSLILFIFLTNLVGLIPYVYGLTSNLWVASGLALTFWALILLSGWLVKPSESAAHLAPAGSPVILAPFLILIETVSMLIRPLTLTVRLVANISAGHIVLALIANCLTGVSGLTLIFMLGLNLGYNMFEVFVCVIQSYIFSLLVKLYAEEHP